LFVIVDLSTLAEQFVPTRKVAGTIPKCNPIDDAAAQ
jgi:hypothetical protein